MIEIKNLSSFYKDKKVLKDISLTIPSSSLTVIIGPNGCGKTTLLKSMTGLIEKTVGNVLIDGRDIKELSIKEIARKISYLSQSRSVPSILAEKMVLHGRFPYLSWPRHYSKKDFEIVKDAMIKTDCYNLRKTNMNELSGGEKQKVYLAMSLSQNTSTIFMDEPTTYLDVEHQIALMKRAKMLKEEGKTVVMVLHDLSLALSYADYIIVMKDGLVKKEGSVDEIYNSKILQDVFRVEVSKINDDNKTYYVIGE